MLTADPPIRPPIEDLEEELAAALPQTQGTRFFPMIRRLAWHLLAFLLLGGAAFVLWREFRETRPADVLNAIRAWGWSSAVLAMAFSAASFLLMGVVEWLGLRWAGARIPLRQALSGAFIANGIAHALGSSLLISGAIRARYYGRRGVTLRQVAATTVFQGLSFSTGLATLAGACLLLAGRQEMTAASRIAHPVADVAGITLIAAAVGYVALCTILHRPLSAFGHSIRLPSTRLALAQLTLGGIDNAVAAGIIWVLLPAQSVDYFTFVGTYAPSVIAGQISHVPGGVGVFEGALSTLTKGIAPAALAAAFLGYRLFFFIIPLMLAGGALALDGLRERTRRRA